MTTDNATDSVGDPSRVESCDHDEAYRVARTEAFDGRKHCICGNCGAGLWIVDEFVLVSNKKAKVIDFTYDCDDCGRKFEFPSAARGHECDS